MIRKQFRQEQNEEAVGLRARVGQRGDPRVEEPVREARPAERDNVQQDADSEEVEQRVRSSRDLRRASPRWPGRETHPEVRELKRGECAAVCSVVRIPAGR